MYDHTIDQLALAAAENDRLLLQKPLAYFLLSALAGALIGFGSMLLFSIGQVLPAAAYPWGKFLGAAAFAAALMLVVMAGAELFTGNLLATGIGAARHSISLPRMLWAWLVCWFGNLAGSLLLAALFQAAGLVKAEDGIQVLQGIWNGKVDPAFMALLARGILCNALVCLAVWCAKRMQSESGKLIIIFFCIFTFVACGYEHSIANMSLLSLAMMNGLGSCGGLIHNLAAVTLGNILGAYLFLILPYLSAYSGQHGKEA